MRARIYQPEIMDEETVDQETADEIYRYLASINRLFGGVNGTIARFEAFSRSWRPGERIEVRGCDLWTLRDGKVVKKDSFWKIRTG